MGCFATGYYLVRARTGHDLREIGSGSTGARNAGRVLGKTGFAGHVAGRFWQRRAGRLDRPGMDRDNHLALLALLAVVAGHLWPAQLHFHGGKGVATSFGALLVFDYRVALMFPVLFLVGFALYAKIPFAGHVRLCLFADGRLVF